MIFQLEFRFWFCALAIFVLVRLRPPVLPSTWFALLNLVAVYLLLGVRATALILGLASLLWLCLFVARKQGERVAGAVLLLVATIGIGLGLFWQKLLFEFVQAGATVPLPWSLHILALISFSYVALRAWDAIAAVRDGAPLLDPLALSGYLAPFFMMPAGPVNVYRQHAGMDVRGGFPVPDWHDFLDGVEVIVTGLFMKFVLAGLIRLIVVGVNGDWPSTTAADTLISFIYIYFDFAGYSLIALGLGRLIGVPTPVNFDRPWLATSLTDFWSRWHMSLGDWVRRHIYLPLQFSFMRRFSGGSEYAVNAVSLIVAFTFVGLWHRFTLPFLVWGVLFGCILAVEKYVRDTVGAKFFERYPALIPWFNFIGPVYVLATVVMMLHLTAMQQMIGNVR
jgi:alginate O-acetyltransferase complex protein AlgI